MGTSSHVIRRSRKRWAFSSSFEERGDRTLPYDVINRHSEELHWERFFSLLQPEDRPDTSTIKDLLKTMKASTEKWERSVIKKKVNEKTLTAQPKNTENKFFVIEKRREETREKEREREEASSFFFVATCNFFSFSFFLQLNNVSPNPNHIKHFSFSLFLWRLPRSSKLYSSLWRRQGARPNDVSHF